MKIAANLGTDLSESTDKVILPWGHSSSSSSSFLLVPLEARSNTSKQAGPDQALDSTGRSRLNVLILRVFSPLRYSIN